MRVVRAIPGVCCVVLLTIPVVTHGAKLPNNVGATNGKARSIDVAHTLRVLIPAKRLRAPAMDAGAGGLMGDDLRLID